MAQLEDLIEEMGGLGRYQILLTFCITVNMAPAAWSMLLMSFSGHLPNFHCLANTSDVDRANYINDSLNVCFLNGSRCSSYAYLDHAQNVISEWNLVCRDEYIKRVIISAQMAGVFIGAVLAGQLSDAFGRKKVLYLSQAEHTIMNFIAAMSVSWPMFVACRFFIGLPVGAVLVVCVPYPVEFCPIKWRPLTSIIPAFALGGCIFAMGTYLTQSWSMLHILCGGMCLLTLLGAFFVPESIRWLATQNKTNEGLKVIKQIASWNKRLIPEDSLFVLEQIAIREQITREDQGHYTYLDIFRTWQSTKISLTFCFFWFTMSTTFYGISFGVSSLSGNLHANILLLSLIETPTALLTMYFSNTFGRRKNCIAFCSVCMLSTTACIIIELFAPQHVKDIWINVLCFLTKMFINGAWAIISNWGPELYPTVTRYLGFGFANMGARIGGVVSPFIINFDSMKIASYGCMACLFAMCILLSFFIQETRGIVLRDTLELPRKTSSVREKSVNKENIENLQRLHDVTKRDEGVNII